MVREVFSFFRKFIVFIFRTPYFKKLEKRYPAIYLFLAARFSIRKFSGMPLTLLLIAMVSNLLMLLDTYGDILNSKQFVTIDNTVAEMLYGFRTDFIARVFYILTQFGNQYVIMLGVMILSVFFIIKKKSYVILGLMVSVAGSSLTVQLGKHIFKVGRPHQYSYYQMDSYSFPSGHATAAVAFYGVVFYLLIKNAKRLKSKFYLLIAGLILILTIGFSRMYLCEHYLSDVVGGYLLGFWWLLLSISILLWKEDKLKRLKKTNT